MNARTILLSSVVAASLLMAGLLGMGCQQTGGGGGDNTNDNTNDNDSGPPSAAQKQDLWITNTKSSSVQDFSSSPLPAGFFDFDGRSCDAFAGATSFVGTALSQNTTGAADTIVTRDGDPIAPSDPVGATGAVAVRITSLNLRGTTPVQVLCDGQPTEWNVHATLSDAPSPEGTLTATKTHDNGGTAETILPVLFKLTFTNVEMPTIQHVLDFAESGLDPVEFHAQMTWVHKIDPNAPDSQAGFIVGVAGGPEAAKLITNGKAGPRLQGGQTLIACSEHGNPGGSHLHNTCIVDTDGDGIPDGVDNCRSLYNPDQEDRDGDRFGDLCDRCPDDPTCPQSGDECETVCRDVNDELLAANTALAPLICEMFSTCMCLPPSCDPLSFELPERCTQLITEITNTSSDFICLYTRFTGWGCDRCVLPPIPPWSCPDPCETTTCPEGQTCQQFLGCFPDFEVCAFANCPAGQGCDPENGQCCEDPAGGCPLPTFDFCGFVTCPAGSQCNPATGQCWNPQTGECFEQEINSDPCMFVTCDAGEFCDPLTGTCVSIGFTNICDFVTCPTGETCDPLTGTCVSLGHVVAPGHVVIALSNQTEIDERLLDYLLPKLNLTDAEVQALVPRIRMRVRITYIDGTFETVEFIDGSSNLVDPAFEAQSVPDLNETDLTNFVAVCDVASVELEPGSNIEVFIPVEMIEYELVESTAPGGETVTNFELRSSVLPQFRPLGVDEVDSDGNVTLQRNIGVRDVLSPTPNIICGSVVVITVQGTLAVPFLDVVSPNAPSYDRDDEATIARIGGRYQFIVTVQ